MKIELTDKVSSKKIAVDPKMVRLIEPADGGGCHIVFGAEMGRMVVEEYDDLKPFFEVIPVTKTGLALVKAQRR